MPGFPTTHSQTTCGQRVSKTAPLQELDLLEELHDTGFLQALAKAKGMVSAEEDNLPEDSGNDPENSSGESAENSEPDRKRLKKGKKAKPVLLKDVMRDKEVHLHFVARFIGRLKKQLRDAQAPSNVPGRREWRAAAISKAIHSGLGGDTP